MSRNHVGLTHNEICQDFSKMSGTCGHMTMDRQLICHAGMTWRILTIIEHFFHAKHGILLVHDKS